MRKLFLILLFAAPAFAQNVRVDNVAFSSVQGFPFLPNATITICTAAGTGQPCTPTVSGLCATISDAACTQPATFQADFLGNFGFWIQPGSYTYTVTKAGFGGFGPKALTLPCQLASTCTITGPQTFSGNLTVSGTGTLAVFNCKNFEGNYCVDSTNTQNWTGANGGAQIASAISAAAVNGGHVYIMPGNYNVTANIALATKVSVECVGGWNNTTLTWTGGAGPNSIFFGSSLTDVQVKDCHLVGPNATTAGTSDVRGIEIDGTTRHFISHNKITGMSYGIFEQGAGGLPGSDGIIKDNWLQTMTFDCVVTFDNHVQVLNNRCDSVGTSALHHGIYNSGGQDILDQGNQVSNVQGFCINAVTSGASGQNNEQTRLIGNDCVNGGQATSSARGGYSVGFGGVSTFNRKALVIGNTIEGLSTGGTGIQAIDSNYVTISGNVMRNVGADCIFLDAINGITDFSITDNVCVSSGAGNGINSTAVATTNGTISGNVFDTIQLNGIDVGPGQNISIFGNTITSYNVANASANCIHSNGAVVVISNNVCKSSVATGFGVFVDTAATDNVVSGNKVFGNGGAINDSGTRTLVFGNKINNTDALFRSNTGMVAPALGPNTSQQHTIPASASDTFALLAASQAFSNKTINVPFTSGTGFQLFNTTTTCTTAASVGATCTTAVISLPVAEADTSYRITCTGKGPTAVPVVSSIANSSATQFTITIAALTAVAASFSSYDCMAGHN